MADGIAKFSDGDGTKLTQTNVGSKVALDVNLAAGSVSINPGDIEIGAVEIKNGTDDTRAKVTADLTLAVSPPSGIGTKSAANSISTTTASDEAVPLGQATAANSVPVTMASDQPPMDVELKEIASGNIQTVNAGGGASVTPIDSNGNECTDGAGNLKVVSSPKFVSSSEDFAATGNGTPLVSTSPLRSYSMEVDAVGAVTSWDVRLEVSYDGTNWSQIGQHTNVTPGDGQSIFVADKPDFQVRSRVAGLVLGGGTNITVKLLGID